MSRYLALAFALSTVACAADPEGSNDAEETGWVDLDADVPPADDEAGDPPSNWSNLSTTDLPTAIYITTEDDNSDSGSTNNLTVKYRNESGTFQCSISGGIASGATASCTSFTQSSTETDTTRDDLYIGYSGTPNTDGLLVTEVKIVTGGSEYVVSKFTKAGSDIDCWGGDATYTAACWIDSDAHKKCKQMKIKLQGNKSEVGCTG